MSGLDAEDVVVIHLALDMLAKFTDAELSRRSGGTLTRGNWQCGPYAGRSQ